MTKKRRATVSTGGSKRRRSVATPQKVWLDCDPGHDDSLAIILAGFTRNIKLLGISTVGSNQSVEKTTLNACKVVAATGLNVKVYAGQGNPLCASARHDPEIHGQSGLDGSEILSKIRPSADLRGDEKGVLAMAAAILEQTTKVWIIATGSLTNVALALTLFPEMTTKLHGVCLMGGCLGVGNRGPVQEFNILCDPEAAKIVFALGRPPTKLKVVMVPLEVTHTAIVTTEVLNAIARIHPRSPIPKFCIQLLQFFSQSYKTHFGFRNGPPLHDPCAVAYVVDPSLFEVEYMNVEIETSSTLTSGQTVCDVWHSSDRAKCVYVCRSMNVEQFWMLMLNAISNSVALCPAPDGSASSTGSRDRAATKRTIKVSAKGAKQAQQVEKNAKAIKTVQPVRQEIASTAEKGVVGPRRALRSNTMLPNAIILLSTITAKRRSKPPSGDGRNSAGKKSAREGANSAITEGEVAASNCSCR